MNFHLLAFSVDFGDIRRLIVQDEDGGLVSILSKRDGWKLPPFGNCGWHPYWAVHTAVNKQEFEWIVQPYFDEMGFVRNSLKIHENEILQAIDVLTLAYNRGLLPASSLEEMLSLWRREGTEFTRVFVTPAEEDRVSGTAMESTRGVSGRKIVAVIPAYNEERFIGSVVLRAREYADAVIVVDDGSTDATGEIAEAVGAIVVRHKHNRGRAAALNTGFRKARGMVPEVVVTLYSGWQYHCEEIPILVRPVLEEGVDMVVGSRFLRVNSSVAGFRALAIRALTLATNVGSGLGLSDSQTGFRAFSRRAIETVTFRSGGFSVESEMQFLARVHELEVLEAPITCDYDDSPKRNPILHWFQVMNGILRLIGQYRPLLFFGVPGMAMLLFGLFWGARVVGIYRNMQTLAVGSALISVLLSIVGSLSLSVGIVLHSIRGFLLAFMRSREM